MYSIEKSLPITLSIVGGVVIILIVTMFSLRRKLKYPLRPNNFSLRNHKTRVEKTES